MIAPHTDAPHHAYRAISRAEGPVPDAGATSLVRVGRAVFGAPRPVVIAGPCAVESARQTLAVARAVRALVSLQKLSAR